MFALLDKIVLGNVEIALARKVMMNPTWARAQKGALRCESLIPTVVLKQKLAKCARDSRRAKDGT